MIEAYTIATRLTLKGDAQQKLARYIETVKRAHAATEVLSKRLRLVNDQLLKASEISHKLNPRLARLSAEFNSQKESLSAVNRSFTNFNAKVNSSLHHTDKLSHKITNLTKELDALAVAGGAAMAGLGGMGAASAGMAGGAIAAGRSRRHGGLHVKGVHAGPIGYTAPTLLGGAALYAGYGLTKSSYKHAKHYQQALARFEQFGFGNKVNANADFFAMNTNLRGISYTDMMEAQVDAINATKHPETIKAISAYMAKNAFANKALYGKGGSHKQVQDLIRAAEEITGSADPNVVMKKMDLFQRMYTSSGGRVTFSDIYQFVRQAGSGIRHYSDDAILKQQVLMQEYGASKAGTATLQMNKALLGGTMTKAAFKQLQKLGLINHKKVEVNPTTGLVTRVRPGAVKNADILQHDDIEWVSGTLLPALQKKGINKQSDIDKILFQIFSNSNVARYVSLMIASLGKIDLALKANRLAQGTEGAYKKALNIPEGKEKALAASWDKLMTVTGKLSSPAVMAAMDGFTDFLDKTTALLKPFAENSGFVYKALTGSPKDVDAGDIVKAIMTVLGLKNQSQNIETVKPNSKNQPIQVQTTINLDGKPIARAVSNEQAKSLSKPPAHGAHIDYEMAYTSGLLSTGF